MPLLLILLFSTAVSLAVIHVVALKLFLYWKYFWLDIPMHFFGGVVCALGFSICTYSYFHTSRWARSIFGYIFFTLLVGVSWEIFEVVTGFSIIDEYFVSDTVKDLVMDIVGGVTGYGIVNAIRKLE